MRPAHGPGAGCGWGRPVSRSRRKITEYQAPLRYRNTVVRIGDCLTGTLNGVLKAMAMHPLNCNRANIDLQDELERTDTNSAHEAPPVHPSFLPFDPSLGMGMHLPSMPPHPTTPECGAPGGGHVSTMPPPPNLARSSSLDCCQRNVSLPLGSVVQIFAVHSQPSYSTPWQVIENGHF